MSDLRKALRDAIFADENTKAQTRPLTLFGQQVELRQPSLTQINKLAKASADEKHPGIVRIMIEYLFVPGTDEKVFDMADADVLASLPGGKWLNDLTTAINELSGVDVKAAEKNSEETD